MSQQEKNPLTVRALLAVLADCDPDAIVDLHLPEFFIESDKFISSEPDALGVSLAHVPVVSASFLTSAENSAHYFDEQNRIRPGVKPNRVSIDISEEDAERLLASRKRAIERDDESAGLEPEPITADADTVVVDVRMPREVHASIRRLLRDVNASRQVREEQACTHGLLTVAGALEMLAQDLGMVESRPGSWEGSNMAQVLSSHGYGN